MKGARVTAWGKPPQYMELPELPEPGPTELRLRMLAVGIPRVVQARASGVHPSAQGKPLPYDPAVDGVGRDEATGQLYMVNGLMTPLLSAYINIPRRFAYALDADADPVSMAALSNNTQSGWLALQCRTTGGDGDGGRGCRGRTVAILGATSNSGRCAARVARLLGAAKVVGLARRRDGLETVEGLDERVVFDAAPPGDENLPTLPASVGPIHIILDYVGGSAAIQLMQAAEVDAEANLQYIQIGNLSGCPFLQVPARLINVKPIRIMGSGLGSFSRADIARELPGFVQAMQTIKTPPYPVVTAPLSEVATVWDSEEAKTKRLVLIP